MNGRLYRLTPAGGKPNHYTDSYASTLAKCRVDVPGLDSIDLYDLEVGERWICDGTIVERVA